MQNYIEGLICRKIKNLDLFHQAFRHRSYANECTPPLTSYERLEFLGDAVLELLVSDYLYTRYPSKSEGSLTQLRAQLVREPSLAHLARKLEFSRYLRLSRGEEASGGRQRDSLLADCFEAVLGAIYLDQGLEVARNYIERVMLADHQSLLNWVNQDYKTQLQERLQTQGPVRISYKLVKETGPDHQRQFQVALQVNGQELSRGQGTSKKRAEMAAAEAALSQMEDGMDPCI